MNIFSGIKILDLSRVFSGPFATRHFSDYGAEVIKVEPPSGDDSRNFPPIVDNWSGYFEVLNRNKTSIFLDLKKQEDLKAFYKLCEDADVVVENYTPGITGKLKVDYETLKKIKEDIIYTSVVGVSDKINRKYYDVLAQAESGLISLNGRHEDMKISTSVADAFSGMKAAFAIASALYYRLKTGRGLKITVSMRGSAFDLLEQNLIESSVSKTNPGKVGNMDNAIAPFGVFKTKNGSVVIAAGNDTLWAKLSEFIEEREPSFNKSLYSSNFLRLKNINNLVKDMEGVFSQYDTSELVGLLEEVSIPCSKVNKMSDVINDKENYDLGLLEKVYLENVGEVTLPTGGINFKGIKKADYKKAPIMEK